MKELAEVTFNKKTLEAVPIKIKTSISTIIGTIQSCTVQYGKRK